MIIIKEFDFDAAHYLPAYNGKCEHLMVIPISWW